MRVRWDSRNEASRSQSTTGNSDSLTSAAQILAHFSFPATYFIVGETIDGPHEFWWDTLERVFVSDDPLPVSISVALPTLSLNLHTVSGVQRRVALERLATEFWLLPREKREELRQRILDWSGVKSDPERGHRPMTADEVRRLAGMSGAEIGAHTESHLWLPAQTQEVQRFELATTKARLEELLGRPVTSVSYPWGAHDATTLNIARRAGFEEGVTTQARPVLEGMDRLALPRYDASRWLGTSFAGNLRSVIGTTRPVSTSVAIMPKALVAGWFSFPTGHATAGDLLARDLACEWLSEAGYGHDVAGIPPFPGSVALQTADPAHYSVVVFVCGPFAKCDELDVPFLERFKSCRLIGLNLSMLLPLRDWNPFDTLLERDSSDRARPDIVFLSPSPHVPVMGMCLVEAYQGADTAAVKAAATRLVDAREMAVVDIDTRLDVNGTGLCTPGEIEALIARMDVVLTSRLHGTVLALKNGVPAICIDPEPGGGKVLRQAQAIGWPWVFTVDALAELQLQRAFDHCMSEDARVLARECASRARASAEQTRKEFLAALPGNEQRHDLAGG